MSLITEQEVYDACNLWMSEVAHKEGAPVYENEQRTFMVVVFQETPTAISQSVFVLDPGIPEPITRTDYPLLTQGQQAALLAASAVKEVVQKSTLEIIKMHAVADMAHISFARALEIFQESKDSEEFLQKIRALRKEQ